jgi:hypothetical protein
VLPDFVECTGKEIKSAEFGEGTNGTLLHERRGGTSWRLAGVILKWTRLPAS